MLAIGLILLLLGIFVPMHILFVIGLIFTIVGAVLMVAPGILPGDRRWF